MMIQVWRSRMTSRMAPFSFVTVAQVVHVLAAPPSQMISGM